MYFVSVDGSNFRDIIARDEELISGSPQFKRASELLYYFGMSDTGDVADVNFLRNGKEIHEIVHRGGLTYFDAKTRTRNYGYHHKEMETPDSGIYYFDLRTIADSTLKEKEQQLSHGGDEIKGKGFIFDMRGYPTFEINDLLSHLTDDTLHSVWFLCPEIIYPDHENLAGYDSSRWSASAENAEIQGKGYFPDKCQRDKLCGVHYGIRRTI